MSLRLVVAAVLLVLLSAAGLAGSVTTPKEQFGFNLGDDYCLANYAQLSDYWKKLDSESDRLRVVPIGETEEGREMLMAIVTSPENHRDLERYREISRTLALGADMAEHEARALAAQGKAIVWIDGGLHATEVLVAQQLMEMVYQMVSLDDDETHRFLDDVIALFCCPNPDGLDLVANWYMREEDPKKRSTRNLPRLYQKYIGHDNNRDFYMITQKETEAICRVFFREWFPQIVFNHHQTGPSGTVLFAPPFRDPFNYNFDPLVPIGIDLVGAAIHARFIAEGKPGATMREGASYSTWWNGGLRTAVYFHNMIGLLTETIGHPTPMEIPLRTSRLLPSADLPYPITPQKWHFRQSVEYSITSNRAVLDVAARNKEHFLFNAWRMARNSIERGNRDHWTVRPKWIEELDAAVERIRAEQRERRGRDEAAQPNDGREKPEAVAPAGGDEGKTPPEVAVEKGAAGVAAGAAVAEASPETEPPPEKAETSAEEQAFAEVMRHPDRRDPRGYILPSDQRDFLTATKFVNALIKSGVTVHRATHWFEVAGRTYPAGSYVVKCAQAFRPHILDMFEPQTYPDDVAYPGGPPKPPYDSAGWTLAYQMGVEFDRILDGFDGPFEKIEDLVAPPPGVVAGPQSGAGFVLSHDVNDAFVAIQRLLKKGESVSWLSQPVECDGKTWPAGSIYVKNQTSTLPQLKDLAAELGLDFGCLPEAPEVDRVELRPVRIGLWDRYGGSMPSGWIRWILERFEFDFEVVYPPELDRGGLAERFDVLIFPGGSIPTSGGSRRFSRSRPDPESIPEEYRDRLGRVTVEKTIPRLREFVEAGGTLVAIGSATAIGEHFGLPLRDALVEFDDKGEAKRLPREKYYVPGSVLLARADTRHPIAYGIPEHVHVYFNNSPVFRLKPEAALRDVRPFLWFDTAEPLRSGWALGQHYLQDGVLGVDARLGRGSVFLFGPEITFRAQPHGTFKFLFNALHLGPARAGRDASDGESDQAEGEAVTAPESEGASGG